METCKHCIRPAKAKGYCWAHYRRPHDPSPVREHVRNKNHICHEPDCTKPAETKRLCRRHYQQDYRIQRIIREQEA